MRGFFAGCNAYCRAGVYSRSGFSDTSHNKAKQINPSVGYGIYDVPYVWLYSHSNAKHIHFIVGTTIGRPQNDGRFHYREREIGKPCSAMRTSIARPYGSVCFPQLTRFLTQRPAAGAPRRSPTNPLQRPYKLNENACKKMG